MAAPRKCDHDRAWYSGALRCPICTRERERQRMRRIRGYNQPRKAYPHAASDHRRINQLRDGYVRAVLSARSHLPTHAWPRSAVELKRAALHLKRRLWKSPLLTKS